VEQALRGGKVMLQDLMSDAGYEREGDDLLNRGLYLDLPAWGFHVFACQGGNCKELLV
jgi:hypothetical protein